MKLFKHFLAVEVPIDERTPAMIQALDDIPLAELCAECKTYVCKHTGVELERTIRDKWSGCTACSLHKSRKNTVFGTGNIIDPKFFIIGQGPDETEDKNGDPFIGPDSVHLNGVMKAAGIDRATDCYLTNAVSCRPWIPATKKNISPTTNSILTCRPRLIEEYQKVDKSVKCIVLMGREAYITWMMYQEMSSAGFDPNRVRISEVLGWHLFEHMPPVYVVYHPSYIARREDRQLAVEWLNDWKAISLLIKSGELLDPRKGLTS